MSVSSATPFRIGVVVNEFFCSEYPPLGGFGLTAKNLATFFNRQPSMNGQVVALLPPYRGVGSAPTRLHDTPVLQVPTALHQIGQARGILQRARLDLIVAIDYYPSYFTRLAATPTTPLLLWLRDPRAPQDWERILSLAGTDFPCEYRGPGQGQGTFKFYRELEFVRRLLRRKFLCAVQESWLLPRARAACPWIGETAVRLVNRITIMPPPSSSAKAERPTLLFVGRLMPVKRPWMFFEIAKRRPDYDFWVVGEHGRRTELKEIVAAARTIPNLHFLDRRIDADLHRVFERAWMLVNTSLHEGMPQSVLDSLACGVPVVSGLDLGGTVERFGIAVGTPHGDGLDEIDAFCCAIDRLVHNPGERHRLGANAHRFAEANYSDKAFACQFASVMDRLGIGEDVARRLRLAVGKPPS